MAHITLGSVWRFSSGEPKLIMLYACWANEQTINSDPKNSSKDYLYQYLRNYWFQLRDACDKTKDVYSSECKRRTTLKLLKIHKMHYVLQQWTLPFTDFFLQPKSIKYDAILRLKKQVLNNHYHWSFFFYITLIRFNFIDGKMQQFTKTGKHK